MSVCLCERLTFDRLFRISEPKRVWRSFTVKGPPLEIDSYQDVAYYIFNFKANPSTTGLRHRGYVKFFKPEHKNPKNVPLQHLDCLVDCTCPDFRYRWAWANKQRQSSVVGPNSLNQAWNKAPRITNPKGAPGLCKHILAARQFIYGLLSSFPGDEPDTAHKLDRLTKYATKRWSDFEGQMQAAKAKEQEIRRRREMRNIGQQPDMPPRAPVQAEPQEPAPAAPQNLPAEKKPKAPGEPTQPEPLPLAIPPGQRGRTMPAAAATPTSPVASPLGIPPGERGRGFATPKPKRVIGNRVVTPPNPSAYGWIRPEEALLCVPLRELILESVVRPNGEIMSNITEAIKLVEEMEADELDHIGSEAPPSDMGIEDIGGDTLEPSEPPVSDSAIGADTEGESALSLLRSMKNSLEQIAAAVAPVEEMPPGAEGADGMGGMGGPPVPAEGAEGEGELPMPDEPPADIEGEAAAEGESPEEEAEEHGEKPPPKKKKGDDSDDED